MARAAEKLFILELMARTKNRFGGRDGGNADLVARAAEKLLNSDLRPRGNSDLVAGLETIQT